MLDSLRLGADNAGALRPVPHDMTIIGVDVGWDRIAYIKRGTMKEWYAVL